VATAVVMEVDIMRDIAGERITITLNIIMQAITTGAMVSTTADIAATMMDIAELMVIGMAADGGDMEQDLGHGL
jgi:hypothetical protein